MKIKKFGNLRLYRDKPTIIAEAGVNHGCDINLALKYIKLAKVSGVEAIKFQTYKAEKIVAKKSPAYWDLKKEKEISQFSLFKKYDKFNYKDYLRLYTECKKKNLTFMTTLFDLESVEKYDSLIQVYKISSSDITNFPLLKSIGLKKKHTIISTGASKISEIKKAIAILNLPKAKICLMHCVLNYPTKDKDANLYFIKKIKKFFPEYLIGYSDHTEPKNDLISIRLAYQLGAKIIEKHFTHNKMLKGNDHYHSANFTDFINFYNILKLEKKLRGDGKENVSNQTRSILNARRSIYIKNDIKPGDKILEKDIISLRPCYGISSIDWNKVIGKKLKKTKKKGEPLYWKDLV